MKRAKHYILTLILSLNVSGILQRPIWNVGEFLGVKRVGILILNANECSFPEVDEYFPIRCSGKVAKLLKRS